MAYECTGKIKLIQEVQTFDSGFTKREMVVTVEDEKYPQDINFEFLQDKITLLEELEEGQEVTVTFDIRGREYNGRFFNNLVGWRIEAGGNKASSQAAPDEKPPLPDDAATPADDDDDLPF